MEGSLKKGSQLALHDVVWGTVELGDGETVTRTVGRHSLTTALLVAVKKERSSTTAVLASIAEMATVWGMARWSTHRRRFGETCCIYVLGRINASERYLQNNTASYLAAACTLSTHRYANLKRLARNYDLFLPSCGSMNTRVCSVTSLHACMLLLATHTWAGTAKSVSRLAMGWTVRDSNPGGGTRFSAPVQIGPGVHPASCTIGTGFLSRG